MLHIWHWIVHIMGVDYGVSFGVWIWYNMWSGIGGSFLATILGVWIGMALVWWRAFSCHRAWWCFRHGRYEMAGGTYKMCHKHHPDMDGKKPTWEDKLRHHQEWKEAATA